MLKQFIERNHFLYVEKVSSWEEAISLSCKPLIEDGTIQSEYSHELIECVKKYGSYIVLMPGVAMPHSQENADLVNRTSISFMKLKEPVFFDEEDDQAYADLFFTLASCNSDEHLENMKNLSELLMNEEIVKRLHEIESEDDLKKLSKEYDI